ncbi:MAG: hypothetical protein LM580_01275 [Thermofilum sp.]|nr:hypothetical protein [Thermofilum sp.]
MAEALEEFYKWRAEVCEVLRRLSERPSALPELEELHKLVENADYRDLPRILVRMTALALFAPELKQCLPSIQTAARWIEAERARRLKTIRKYAFAHTPNTVVVNFFRWDIVSGTYEYFALAEIVRPGMPPSYQRTIGGSPVYANKASMTVVDRREFAEVYGNRRLMAVIHVVSELGEEYFFEELSAEELLSNER